MSAPRLGWVTNYSHTHGETYHPTGHKFVWPLSGGGLSVACPRAILCAAPSWPSAPGRARPRDNRSSQIEIRQRMSRAAGLTMALYWPAGPHWPRRPIPTRAGQPGARAEVSPLAIRSSLAAGCVRPQYINPAHKQTHKHGRRKHKCGRQPRFMGRLCARHRHDEQWRQCLNWITLLCK